MQYFVVLLGYLSEEFRLIKLYCQVTSVYCDSLSIRYFDSYRVL